MPTFTDASTTQNVAITILMDNRPAMIVPSHYTGFKAQCQFSREMSRQFVVGAT